MSPIEAIKSVIEQKDSPYDPMTLYDICLSSDEKLCHSIGTELIIGTEESARHTIKNFVKAIGWTDAMCQEVDSVEWKKSRQISGGADDDAIGEN